MHIYLRHPEHGTKVAISELEATADENNGWKRYDPDTPPLTEQANELGVKRRRRTKED